MTAHSPMPSAGPPEDGSAGEPTQPEAGVGEPGCPDDELPDLLACDGGKHPPLKRVLLVLGAVVCLVLGVVGWLVPVITGVPFYLAGLVLLAKAIPAVGRWINARERRLPRRYRLWLRPRMLAEQRRKQRGG